MKGTTARHGLVPRARAPARPATPRSRYPTPDVRSSVPRRARGRTGWDTRTVVPPDPRPLGLPVDAQLAAGAAGGLAALARDAEAAGFARLWAPELYRSATVSLAVAAG